MTKEYGQFNGERILFSKNGLEQLDQYAKKKKLDTNLIPIIKINPKWITNLRIKHNTIKLLEDNIGENLCNLRFGDEFLNIIIKVWSMKEKIDKCDFIKIRNSMKDTMERMKR